ncbi:MULTISPECIES: hypothetical protein [unclassified Streptomyces]|uniref:hypothetical protein n=1 Tax=unclassified Streptomyces TaxID=2593676 RepID=UPI002785C615|nr:hypothetical protein [Streptomyces sp. B4I13]MDQ0961318.1 hypothetical protein [Streptomyces sp. B4I13]
MRIAFAGAVTGAALRTPAARVGFALLPVLSLGLLCPVPSLVLALRRRSRADWWAFVAFSAVLAAWVTELSLTPVDTHGALFALDVLLIALSTAGAATHAWRTWPQRAAAKQEAQE